MIWQFYIPAVTVVLLGIGVAIATDIRQFKIYNLLILPWVMVGLICFATSGDSVLLTALQGGAVPVLLVTLIVLASTEVVHALGGRR